jgi:hypothetical protein
MVIGVGVANTEELLQQSPITVGYWIFPREKPATPQAIADECRKGVTFQFADGHFFRLSFYGMDKMPLATSSVHEVGYCQFDRAKQIERCDLRIIHDDGTANSGVIESTFIIAADGSISMNVTPKIVNGAPSTETPFVNFPTPCPGAVVWDALNGSAAQK